MMAGVSFSRSLGFLCAWIAAIATLVLSGTFVPVASAQTKPLNDTGQSLCYDTAGSVVTCSVAGVSYAGQDASFGRDARARAGQLTKVGGGAAGFDFTKICMNGQAEGTSTCPANPTANDGTNPAATDWACTRDNVTQLVWSLQTTGTTIWAAATTEVGGSSIANTNAAARCGLGAGWRVPTLRELLSIAHFGTSDPSIDTDYFPYTAAASYWTSQLYQSGRGAWVVSFSTGGHVHPNRPRLRSPRA